MLGQPICAKYNIIPRSSNWWFGYFWYQMHKAILFKYSWIGIYSWRKRKFDVWVYLHMSTAQCSSTRIVRAFHVDVSPSHIVLEELLNWSAPREWRPFSENGRANKNARLMKVLPETSVRDNKSISVKSFTANEHVNRPSIDSSKPNRTTCECCRLPAKSNTRLGQAHEIGGGEKRKKHSS